MRYRPSSLSVSGIGRARLNLPPVILSRLRVQVAYLRREFRFAERTSRIAAKASNDTLFLVARNRNAMRYVVRYRGNRDFGLNSLNRINQILSCNK